MTDTSITLSHNPNDSVWHLRSPEYRTGYMARLASDKPTFGLYWDRGSNLSWHFGWDRANRDLATKS